MSPEWFRRPTSAAGTEVVLAQRAAGVVAARRRGDHAGAIALLNDFDDAPIEECVRDMSLALAAGVQPP